MLSNEEVSKIDKIYYRTRDLLRFRTSIFFTTFFISFISFKLFTPLFKTNEVISNQIIVTLGLFCFVVGLLISAFIFSFYFQVKKDQQFIAFIESHFPEQCSWKKEEKLLADLEEIEVKVRAFKN